MKLGDRICWTQDIDDPSAISEGTVTKITKATSVEALFWIDNQHKPEDCIYQSITYPIAAKEELVSILQERAKLKKAYNDSLKLLFELRNKIVRGEIQ
jgi:hypothetical protein